jgi:superfamily II DNA/RNA helicase
MSNKYNNRNGDRNDDRRNGDYHRNRNGNHSSSQQMPLENTQFNYNDIANNLIDRNNIMCSKEVIETECKSFELMNGDVGLKENLLRGIYSFGYEIPSDIQGLAIPQIISGKNILAQSQSGTGKTGAFIISALQSIDDNLNAPQCIILSPTSELAQQTLNVGKSISEYMENINFSYTVGGTTRSENIKEIDGSTKETSQILIATPGRLLDLLTSYPNLFKHIKLLIIDECDELMAGTFQDDVARIISNLPKTLQICLFSATLNIDIITIADIIAPEHVKILIKKENVTLEGITQLYVDVRNQNEKNAVLINMFGSLPIQQFIVYVNSKKTAEDVKLKLNNADIQVLTIHSDHSKYERAEIINEFKKGHVKCLISTDLLSRGIDIQQLSLVINYDMPKSNNIESYVHRIGRSGRFGKKGLSINLVSEDDKKIQNLITMTFGCEIKILTNDFVNYLK